MYDKDMRKLRYMTAYKILLHEALLQIHLERKIIPIQKMGNKYD